MVYIYNLSEEFWKFPKLRGFLLSLLLLLLFSLAPYYYCSKQLSIDDECADVGKHKCRQRHVFNVVELIGGEYPWWCHCLLIDSMFLK